MNNNKVVYNEMVVRTLCEFPRSESPTFKKLVVRFPEVVISVGAQFVVDFFKAKDVIDNIGYALLCECVKDADEAEVTQLTWRFNSDELEPTSAGSIKAYPMETFSKEDYQDDFQEDDLSLYVTRVGTEDFHDLEKLILCSYWSGNDYVICLPTEMIQEPPAIGEERPF